MTTTRLTYTIIQTLHSLLYKYNFYDIVTQLKLPLLGTNYNVKYTHMLKVACDISLLNSLLLLSILPISHCGHTYSMYDMFIFLYPKGILVNKWDKFNRKYLWSLVGLERWSGCPYTCQVSGSLTPQVRIEGSWIMYKISKSVWFPTDFCDF